MTKIRCIIGFLILSLTACSARPIKNSRVAISIPPHSGAATAPSSPPPPSLSFTPKPQLTLQGPGKVLVPIFLYHQIGYPKIAGDPYYVTPEDFQAQMYILYQWGYHTITMSQLAMAIRQGTELPLKPIALTFDDGDENVYTAALPVLQKYGFVGTAYIVYNYIGTPSFMSKDQILALHSAGWDIGSHSLDHIDLTRKITTLEESQQMEIGESRKKLEALLNVPILTFAYPFGRFNNISLREVDKAGYLAAAGLGPEMYQGPDNIFDLYRRGIEGSYDLKTFAQYLPWRGDINILSTAAPPGP